MTKAGALYEFWSCFGLDAYEENSVPTGEDAPKLPYITYQLVSDSIGNDVPATGIVWDVDRAGHSANKFLNAKVEEISKFIDIMAAPIKCDGGRVWIKKGVPFGQPYKDDASGKVQGRLINVTAEFLTAH